MGEEDIEMQHQSEEFKKVAVQKFHSRGARPVGQIAQELGVSTYSLYQWSKRYGKSWGMKKTERRPQDWSAEEKLKAVIEFENLAPEKQGELLRREGLHSEHMVSWKGIMHAALQPGESVGAKQRGERVEDKRKIKELERELHRKDKALAETAALLILKKKADLIWGTGENE